MIRATQPSGTVSRPPGVISDRPRGMFRISSSRTRSVVIHPKRERSSAELEFLGRTEEFRTAYNLAVLVCWVVVNEPNLTRKLRQRAVQIGQKSSHDDSFRT